MAYVGEPVRIVEDEPITWPAEEPIMVPEPAVPVPVPVHR